ncbi:hypothetical protein THAOC_13213 [Thalassiosira oceanica]|uniref:Uncharacterized protein n=1 Tax=Thalassiosira oceanica TaxID=159749 RepID=K0SLM5_THAOC|nr:hypothetical protein THAOC_13213 [Thalassiosira oceanica]|eukprot:EJK65889.1 hypothetical protein THAOC_13213 [Thalassiosira oceanica]
MSSRTNCAFERCWESNLLSEDTIHSDEFSSKPVALYPLDAAERTAVPSPLPKSTNSRLRPTAASACLDEMYSRARSTFARGVAMNGSGERICDITNGAVIPTTQMKDPPIRVRASAVCRRVEPGIEPASSKSSAAIVQSGQVRGGGSLLIVHWHGSLYSGPIDQYNLTLVFAMMLSLSQSHSKYTTRLGFRFLCGCAGAHICAQSRCSSRY